jgi:hypothetical protein
MQNEAAKGLWAQIFGSAATLPDAAMHDPDFQSDWDREKSVAEALAEAGWNAEEIEDRISADRERVLIPNLNSPGVGPGLEAILRRLSDRISDELFVTGATAHKKVEVAIDPKVGVDASLTNVIMTDEGIITVSSFLFRWCGLVARAYTRTLIGDDVGYWSDPFVSANEDKLFLLRRPDLALYWCQIFLSFGGTGTHVSVPYRPCRRDEVYLMEQVAWSMEYFTVAHEYGHHMLGHRSIDDDPIEQELAADRFALRICEKLAMEPLKIIENPYLRTGAGATLMLKALAILRSIDMDSVGNQESDTHPAIEKRIENIMNRHAIQPGQLKMDHEFNRTVLRIMNAVEQSVEEFLELGGRNIIAKLKEHSTGWPD